MIEALLLAALFAAIGLLALVAVWKD